jgi:hypothetical protein
MDLLRYLATVNLNAKFQQDGCKNIRMRLTGAFTIEPHKGIYVKWFLKLSNLNENLNGWTVFCKILQY